MFHKNNKNPHFLQKLTNREITGNFIRQGKSNSQNSSASKLFKTIPSRCVYQLSNVIDLPGNHVFMGTSRCGQFLLTYSFITHQARSSLSQRNKYQLHWWLFRPGAKAAKVAEVQLFADYAVTSILTIGIAHWPTVSDRLVVYGFCNNAEDYLEEDHRRYYLTITTLPSLDCRDCLTVAASFDEEDMAANWDSCVSFSCLKHGLTIHSLFDVTPPYPKFDFNISLKLNNSVVFNTVNFLHVLSFEFENPKPDRPAKNEQTIVNEEINHRVGQIMTSKYPKEYALPYDINKAFNTGNSLAKHVMKQTQPTHLPPPASQPTRTSSILHAREKSSRQWCIRIPNLAMKPVSIRTKVWRRSIIDQAEKVYAFEESEDGGCEPKLKWYRRKRLADKMYEFCSDEDDEDMENIRPPDKWGTKLPRYKCLSPPKTTPTKCDVIDSRLSQSEAGLQHPFTKMILNISGNDTRYVIQNTDCCKRLINMKTDADSEIRHKIGSETADHSCNNSRLDETSCARRHRDMDKPVGIQNIQPKSNDTLEDTCRRDRNIMDKSVTNQISPGTECSCESASSKTNNSRLVETCCDAQRRDMENSKENSRREETGCDKQIHVTDKPLEIPPNDHVKTNDILDETCCERSDRDINTPVIIQIPPINLPFCVPSGKKDEPLLKEPVFLTPAAVSDRRVVSDTVSNPLSEVASLLDTVSKMNTRSVENVTDSSEVSDTPESSSSSMIHDTLRDSVSLSPVIDASQINSVSNTTICDKNVPGPNDSVSNPCSVNTADVMDTVDSLVIVDNNKIGSSIKTLSEHSSGNSATVDLNCETNGVSIDTESNISSSIIDKTVSNSPSTNFDNVCRSSKDVSNSFSTDTDSATNSFPLMNENLCNTLNDNISQFCSTDSVCNTSKECLSNSSSTNTDRRNVSKDVVSNSPPSIVDNRNVCNDTVSNLRATYETSNINHDVRAIIADWEADSISSMSPQSEFSSSVTTCNSPKVLSDYSLEIGGENTNERHMTIQRFLEIPPRFGIVKKNFHHNHHHHLHHHRSSSNITSNLNDTGRKLVCPSPTNTNVTRCVPVGLSASQYPPIKLRALQPHNRIRRSYRHDPLLSPPLKCFGIEKEEELRRKKVGSGRSEGGGDSFEMKRRREGKMVGGDCVNKSEVKLVGDSFEVKRRRDVKVGGSGEMKVDGLDLKRKKKDCGDGGGSLEDEFVDILDNIVGRRTISDCSVQLDRRFIEVDEEMISTITDIEDDDQAVGFHCALPLHVHGSAYAQMQMVSNHKVDKLNVPCVSVRQNSLDIEQLCSKAAEVICECEGFKFWFCDDYDAEIVDVCPLDGSVLIVVFMRLNVERLNVPAAETAGFTSPVVVDRRHFYECKCLFIWSTARQECSLEVFTHLRAVPHDRVNVDGWSPAGREAARMRRKAETGFFHLQPSPAIRAFVHRLYDDDDNQTDSALEVQDPTNLMLFRLYPVNSNMKINSNRIVVL